jgi:hypothetical protein
VLEGFRVQLLIGLVGTKGKPTSVPGDDASYRSAFTPSFTTSGTAKPMGNY